MTVLHDATDQQLVEAIAANHRVYFRMEAKQAGGEERQTGPVVWTWLPVGKRSNIAFPRLPGQEAGPYLDLLMDAFRDAPPTSAGCWSLDPPEPADLGVRLLARGFQPGWRPHWMVADLDKDLREEVTFPPGLEITADKVTSLSGVADLPYAWSEVLLQEGEALTQRFIARIDGKIIGQSGVLCTDVAGLYNVSVLPAYRSKGIGKALTLVTCRFARDKGYRYATLNASGDGRRIYNQLGFRSIGDGWTWWLMNDRWLDNTPEMIALAEAIGRGAPDGLAVSEDDLSRPLSNGMTLLELAVHLRQPASVDWLLDQGVPLRPLDAWDLGWKDRFVALLSADPSLVNLRYGDGELTLAHTAVERGDVELLRYTLAAGPDLSITDKQYQGVALGWAYHFGRKEMIRMLGGEA
ncbi:GNAT family N-acetyltransferase [Dinghuibacter silviterrae]|uniref:Putative N-acetyltransferase YhbS n=1 Tax=Dinghuibacter silviterrae TaxID=1539049 RepID=A0A4R8DTT8_9BACT|nr:GNAT family N-acetyltransferase [Dinghuibacter silviterrae]TDX00855.1 putative N-acetyltransferase YhbS [Dinghuibacter silviterrae]